jgi:hypothetical protein
MKKTSDNPKDLPRVKFTYGDMKPKRFQKTDRNDKQDKELAKSIDEMRLMRQGILPKIPY